MSAAPGKAGFQSRSNMPALGAIGNNGHAQASTLLERSNPGLRRSTPDSEALASSDEEVEQSRLRAANVKKLSTRRSSLLADPSNDNRRGSTSAGNGQSPASSQPNTPGTENGPWSAFSPGAGVFGSSGGAYAFGASIWAASRDPPARLQEVSHEGGERIPFTIPLQPTPKNYRSQSYSVGQSEPNTGAQNTAESARPRPAHHLQRRTSRPGGLAGDGGGLRSVNEVEDDEESLRESTTHFRDPRELQLENARLIQLLQNQNRERAFSSSSTQLPGPAFRNRHIRGSVPEESDLVIEDNDATLAQIRYPVRSGPHRRMSDIPTMTPNRQPMTPLVNPALGNSRRTHWSTDLDFGHLDMTPQSRRHSFADVPTRHGSIGSNDENGASAYDDGSQGLSLENEQVFYQQDEVKRLIAEREVQQKMQREQQHSLFGGSTYAIPSNLGTYHGPSTLPLYVVNFKCCRSDVFYIQEGSGLEVQPGDLVIVEADRGTDLGTVQHTNITWDEARKYKAYYAEEHYKWLMMFSQQSRSGGPNLVNPNSSSGRQSAVGGMGPQGHGHRDGHSEIKPKMIKRPAQAHEIQALQEKEGNEARAKRVCQQKVAEHGLTMEILDAEFQMDSKKLTFYYFADEYINFNSLVTDLFKIYKTRIWMSAINPASFQTPTASLGLTPAFGALGFGMQPPDLRNQYALNHESQYEEPRESVRSAQPQRQTMANPYLNHYQQDSMGTSNNNYPSSVQASPDPFSGYNPQAFSGFAHRVSTSGSSRHAFGRGAAANPATSVLAQFQGLSLGRYEPTST